MSRVNSRRKQKIQYKVDWIDDAIKQRLHRLKCECPINDGLIGGIEATNNGIRCTRCGRYKYGEVSHE